MSRTTTLNVDTNAYGDGYTHRATRGLNPARPSWTLQFPFIGQAALQAYEDFLVANAAKGFWIAPPDQEFYQFVTCDSWSMTVADNSVHDGIVGTLQATFARSFNPQPAS